MPIRMLRALSWIPKALQQYATRNPVPSAYWELLSPTFDAFGTSRFGEMQSEHVSIAMGVGPGDLELVHSQVPADRCRFYFSMEVWQDNAVAQILALARIVPGPLAPLFPIARFTSEFGPAQNIRVAFTFQWLGPGSFLALEGRQIASATTIHLNVVWIELPLGEAMHVF